MDVRLSALGWNTPPFQLIVVSPGLAPLLKMRLTANVPPFRFSKDTEPQRPITAPSPAAVNEPPFMLNIVGTCTPPVTERSPKFNPPPVMDTVPPFIVNVACEPAAAGSVTTPKSNVFIVTVPPFTTNSGAMLMFGILPWQM